MTGKNVVKHSLIQIVILAVLIVIDRITKNLAVTYLKGESDISVIGDAVVFHYLENSGAAFGSLQNMQVLFYIVTVAVVAVVFVLWFNINSKLKKYLGRSALEPSIFKKRSYTGTLFLNYTLIVLVAGAVGNLIDRVLQGYVVDFIYFKIIDFPVFNFADICVTLSAAALIVFAIFIYKDDPELKLFGEKKSKKSGGEE